MSIHTAHPGFHVTTKTVAGVLAAGAVTVGAGFGLASLLGEDPVPGSGNAPSSAIEPGPQIGLPEFAGTDRETRALMHLDR